MAGHIRTLRDNTVLPDPPGGEKPLDLLGGDAPLTAELVRLELARLNPAAHGLPLTPKNSAASRIDLMRVMGYDLLPETFDCSSACARTEISARPGGWPDPQGLP